MKRFLIGVGMSLLLSMGAGASMSSDDSGTLLRHQRSDCSLVVKHSTVLSQEKDIQTLAKTRQKLRKVLEKMQQDASRLSTDDRLRTHKDYLLSIEEGLSQLNQLAEEPMTPANLEQIKNMCAFIAEVDQQLLESLAVQPGKSYQVSR
jgi:hypothetical protein